MQIIGWLRSIGHGKKKLKNRVFLTDLEGVVDAVAPAELPVPLVAARVRVHSHGTSENEKQRLAYG